MKRQEVKNNFMRFGSSRAACAFFLIISVFILMRYLNIACLFFKYFDLTVEAYMGSSITLIFWRGNPSEFNYWSSLHYRRGAVSPKLDKFRWGEGWEGVVGSEFWTVDAINEWPLLLLVSNISSLLIFWYLSSLKVQRRLSIFAETRLKPFYKLQSNLSKHVDNVTWQNSLDNFI